MAEPGLFETMYTARALRRYKTDPIPDEIITKILAAATQAPSGSNQQNWVFVVLKDAAKKKENQRDLCARRENPLDGLRESSAPAHTWTKNNSRC